MGDAEARALGSGASIEIELDGKKKEYRLAPIGMGALQEVQREAVESYKRQYLKTFADNRDLFNGQGEHMLAEALERAARWDVDDLPKKSVFDVSQVPVTKKLRGRLESLYGKPEGDAGEEKDEARQDGQWRRLLSAAVDGGEIKPDEVQKLTGKAPKRISSPYDSWWVTADYDGMLTFIRASLREHHPDITKEEIARWPLSKIIEAASTTETMTAPAVGNT